MMLATTILPAVFLLMQSVSWVAWFAELEELWPATYTDDAESGVHILGGLVPMLNVTIRAFADRYSNQRHNGVHYCMMYWHILGVVWVVLFLPLLIGT